MPKSFGLNTVVDVVGTVGSLAPSGGSANQIVKGRTTDYLTYAIPLYAATDRGFLEVTLRELNGARVLVLPVPSRVINRASTI